MAQMGKFTSLLCLLLILLATACSGVARTAATPTAALKEPKLEVKSVLRDFLASLPQDWNLVASQDVAKAKPFIVDVRQPEEYSQGFVEGAINVPLRELAQNLQALPALDKDIVLMDSTGHRSTIGASILQMLGYKKAKSLEGGLQAWRAAKLSVVTSPVPPRPGGQAPKINPQLLAMLDYYLLHTLPYDWGTIDAAGLTADQKLLSSAQMEIQSETYDQGPSLLVDVDTPEEFARFNLTRVINVPLRRLPDALDNMPLQETIEWA